MHAYRNLRLCSKDCMCLYVCPTGATDTETGQIDFAKCVACGACIKACPSHAISMIPEKYLEPKPKKEEVLAELNSLEYSKTMQENIARELMKKADDPALAQIMEAVMRSNRRMNEDMQRESGYMVPQCKNSKQFLKDLMKDINEPGFPADALLKLLEKIEFNQ